MGEAMNVFWGMEVKPGKATLALDAAAGQRVGLSAKVGDGPAVLLCSLREGGQESCNLDIVLDSYSEFSVTGGAAVHLAGYYMPEYEDEEEDEEDDDEDEDEAHGHAHGHGHAHAMVDPRTLRKLQQRGIDVSDLIAPGDDEDDEDHESDDDDEFEDAQAERPGVVITEVEEGAVAADRAGVAAAAVARVVEVAGVEPPAAGGARGADAGGAAAAAAALDDEEDDDDDNDEDDDDVEEDEAELAAVAAQRAAEAALAKQVQESAAQEAKRAAADAKAAAAGKRKRASGASADAGEPTPAAKRAAAADAAAARPEPQPATGKAAKKAAKAEAAKARGGAEAAPVAASANGTPGKAGGKVRTFENGFAIEELAPGQPNGKLAKPGKKSSFISRAETADRPHASKAHAQVVVRYKGTHKGKVFDETKGKATFSFRLGVGEVIKGWDRGVEGMRVGDKRRLTIPPQMAYGSTGAKPAIPPNATLSFVVELVDVK